MAVNFNDYFNASITTTDINDYTRNEHLVSATLTITNLMDYQVTLRGTIYFDSIDSGYTTVNKYKFLSNEDFVANESRSYNLGTIYTAFGCSGTHSSKSFGVYLSGGQISTTTEWESIVTDTNLPGSDSADSNPCKTIATVEAIALQNHIIDTTTYPPEILECYNDINNNIYIKVKTESPGGSEFWEYTIMDREGTVLLYKYQETPSTEISGDGWTLYKISPDEFDTIANENTISITITINIDGYWSGGEYGYWDTITGTYELVWYNGVTIYVLVDNEYQAGRLYVKNGTSDYSPTRGFNVLK